METVHTPELWIPLILIPLIFYILVIIKKRKINKIEKKHEDIFRDAILKQLIESEQNTFMS